MIPIAMSMQQMFIKMVTNGTISSEFAPAVQLYNKGILVALLSATGVILYSTPRGNEVLGSYYQPARGYHINNFLQSDLDAKKLELFVARVQAEEQKEAEEEEPRAFVECVRTRSGLVVILQPCDNCCLTSATTVENVQLRRKKVKEDWDEMSFNDAFDYAAYE
jgi:hypothetical protein